MSRGDRYEYDTICDHWENLGVCESATVTSATIIGMLIVCWAIYTVYTLHNALAVKEIADKLLSYACEGAHATICEGHTDDRDYCLKSMMDLIMILIREYGGAISSKMLYQLLDRCDHEYDQALQTIIDTGLLECSIRDDGDIACFYIP